MQIDKIKLKSDGDWKAFPKEKPFHTNNTHTHAHICAA